MDLTGRVLKSRYRVDAALGQEGSAEVFRAVDLQQNTPLTLRLLIPVLAADETAMKRIKKDAAVLAGLQHPNIVRFFGLDQEENLVFLLTELVAGTNLQTEIVNHKKRPFTNDQVLGIMGPSCVGLGFAHSQKAVHGDIKPANVLIDQTGKAMLANLGLTRMIEGAAAATTPEYTAPEVIQGKAPTALSDIYSLGVVLYEMMTGERPFSGQSTGITGTITEKIRWEQVNANPPAPSLYDPLISREMEAIILRCLAKNPKDRYASVEDLLKDLERACLPKAAPVMQNIPVPPAPPVQAVPVQAAAVAQPPAMGAIPQPPPAPVMPGITPPPPNAAYTGYPPMYAPSAPTKKSSKAWIPIVIVVAVLAIAFGVLAFLGIFPPRPEISLSDSSVNFGEQVYALRYDGQTVEVSNTGYGKLEIESIEAEADSGFEVVNDECTGREVERNGSCSFDVVFKPTDEGSSSSTITINANKIKDPVTLEVSGKSEIPPCNVAILGAPGDYYWFYDIQYELDYTGLFDQVDIYDMESYMDLTLDDLKDYRSVLVFSDDYFYDTVALGDLLADYTDYGGGVVLATFAFNPSYDLGVGGRIVDDGYLPFTQGDQSDYYGMYLAMDDPSHPILDGVSYFYGGSSSYHEYVTLANGATLVASWDDGTPLIAVNEFDYGRVVGLNFYPVSDYERDDFYDQYSDGGLILGNSLAWAGQCFAGK
jgi:serine/threonine protein kinase